MVKLDTSFETLKDLIGKSITLKELENTLFNLGMELEETSGDEIKIDITAERSDMVSSQGLARVLRAYFGLKNPDYKIKKSNYEVFVDKSVDEVRPHTCCAVIKNLDLDEEKLKEIIWVQEKLHETFGRDRKKVAIGIYPMESIKFPITYKAENPTSFKFRPLEYPKEMTGKEILTKTSTGKQYAHLLQDHKKYPYFIDAKKDILSMPPILNAHETGKITQNTKDVFLECSGHDFDALSKTLNILCYMLQDMGGDVYQVSVKYPKKTFVLPNFKKEKRTIKTSFIEKMTGLQISSKECAKLLEKMMHDVESIQKDSVTFLVPPIRTDIWHDVDIADDIVRGFGVNNIKPELPKVATHANVLRENKIKSKMTEILVGLDFTEVFTLLLTSTQDQYTNMNLDVKQQNYMKLGHSEEKSINMVRTWLMPETLKALQSNRNKSLPLKLFEINEVVQVDKTKDVLSKTQNKLSCLICDSQSDFTQIKQILENLLNSFAIEFELKTQNYEFFIQGRSASIISNGKEVGFIGELSPEVISNWSIHYPIAGLELDLDALFNIV